MAFKLDEVDIQLLNALQADADRTNLELARLVGLSPAATLHRVRALKDSGVIRIIRADVDPAAAGFPLRVFVAAAMGRLASGRLERSAPPQFVCQDKSHFETARGILAIAGMASPILTRKCDPSSLNWGSSMSSASI